MSFPWAPGSGGAGLGSGSRRHFSPVTRCNPRLQSQAAIPGIRALLIQHCQPPEQAGLYESMNHLPAKLRAGPGVQERHQTPGSELPSPAHRQENPGSASRKGGSEFAWGFHALNKRTQVYSSRAWAVPQGKAQGINRDTLQPSSALSTEKFFGLLPFQLTPCPQVSLRGSIPCGMGAGTAPSLPVGQAPGQGPPHLQKPPRAESSRGTALFPPEHILRRPTNPPGHGERKRARTLLGIPPGTAWPPPPPPARQGPLTQPRPPHAGQAHPGATAATLPPGQCPAGRAAAIFCLKRKRFTQRKTSEGPSPSHPHTNRFI